MFPDWILPGALNAFFFWSTQFFRNIHPFGCWTSKAKCIHRCQCKRCEQCEMLCCLYIFTWPVLKTSSTTAASGAYPLSWPMIFFYSPLRPSISGHQDSKPPSRDEQQPCAENSFRVVIHHRCWPSPTPPLPPPLTPPLISSLLNVCSFILHWRIVLSPCDVARLSAGMSTAAPPKDTAMGPVA